MEKLLDLLSKFNAISIPLSLEEEQQMLYEYVFTTNKLEGNQLTLIQTTELFKSDTLSGNNIRTSDILEQKGMYKALKRMLLAIKNNEELSNNLLLELNWLCIGSLWNEDYYLDAKEKGQEKGTFKISPNVISIKKNAIEIEKITPLSTPENVLENMTALVEQINSSTKNILDKAVFIAQEIWLHQPFVDGNKRTGRLLINFLLMKEGFPLFSYNNKKWNYNSLLVEQYYDQKPDLIKNYIVETLTAKLEAAIELNSKIKKNGNGFRLLL
ncbi:Fic family protein [Flavobacterium sp.]|jgi:Fic family protein|uniref:Fic family protein n=1 Tax=Flavobacterium sp. TaxID=239 RepID=UPI0037BE89B6